MASGIELLVEDRQTRHETLTPLHAPLTAAVYRLVVTIPPTVNNLYIQRGRHRVLSPEARQYKADLHHEARAAGWQSHEGQRVDILTTYTVWMPDRRRRDLSNMLKVLEDALCPVLGIDDSRISSIVMQRGGYDKQQPRVEVEYRLVQP